MLKIKEKFGWCNDTYIQHQYTYRGWTATKWDYTGLFEIYVFGRPMYSSKSLAKVERFIDNLIILSRGAKNEHKTLDNA